MGNQLHKIYLRENEMSATYIIILGDKDQMLGTFNDKSEI